MPERFVWKWLPLRRCGWLAVVWTSKCLFPSRWSVFKKKRISWWKCWCTDPKPRVSVAPMILNAPGLVLMAVVLRSVKPFPYKAMLWARLSILKWQKNDSIFHQGRYPIYTLDQGCPIISEKGRCPDSTYQSLEWRPLIFFFWLCVFISGVFNVNKCFNMSIIKHCIYCITNKSELNWSGNQSKQVSPSTKPQLPLQGTAYWEPEASFIVVMEEWP